MFSYTIFREQQSFNGYIINQIDEGPNNTAVYGETIFGDTTLATAQNNFYSEANDTNGNGFTSEAASGATTFACFSYSSLAQSNSESYAGEGIGTGSTYTNSDSITSYSGSDSASNSTETTTLNVEVYITTASSSSSATAYITGNVSTTTVAWTVVNTPGATYATTTTVNTTAVSNGNTTTTLTEGSSSTIASNFTQSYESTFYTTKTAQSTYYIPVEVGSVYIADTDWLWAFKSLSSYTSDYSFLTDIGSSFTQTTFWPIYSTETVAFGGTETQNFMFPQSSKSYSIEYLVTKEELTTITATSGNNLPRDTYTTTASVWTTSSSAFTASNNSYVINANGTTSQLAFTNTYSPLTVYTVYPFGLSDSKSTTLLSTSLGFTTTTLAIGLGVAFTDQQIQSTACFVIGTTYFQLTDINTYLEAAPPVGAMLDLQQLQNNINQQWGGNLQIADQTLYYPFTSGVFSNVAAPGYAPTFSALNSGTETDAGNPTSTWSYEWLTNSGSATLNYSMFTSGATGIALVTSNSGTFQTSSSLSNGFVTVPTCFGGYGAIPNTPETAIMPPRAVLATSVSPDGNSSTYQSIYKSSATSTLLGAGLLVETVMPAFQAFNTAFVGAETPVFPFIRNQI